MKYQLVIQFSASSIKDFDALVEVEDILIENLDDGSDLDGHDVGSGEMNIFIHTDDPLITFRSIKSAIGSRDLWDDARIAYRELSGHNYTVIWPKDLNEFNVK